MGRWVARARALATHRRARFKLIQRARHFNNAVEKATPPRTLLGKVGRSNAGRSLR